MLLYFPFNEKAREFLFFLFFTLLAAKQYYTKLLNEITFGCINHTANDTV
ncbi:MAG: hypothetical protein IPQ05_20340 [Leptospiraceae bacterium]|nr:hypothetical protein [Leptospiraceae bacterium]